MLPDYGDFLLEHLKLKRKLKIVFDGSNGSTGPVLKYIKRKSKGLTIRLLDTRPDGNFVAHGPNPLRRGALNDLSRAVRKHRSDFGAAFDADGDRVFFVDDRGRPVSDEAVSLILLLYLKPSAMVTDVRYGYLLKDMRPKEVRLIVSRVGSYFIKQLMHRKKIPFGAEESGHYYFKQFFFADSGIMAAMAFASAVSGIVSGRLSEWIDNLPRFYGSSELIFRVGNKKAAILKVERHFRKSAVSISRRDGLRMEFSSGNKRWWFLLRPSNTENLLRLNIEAVDKITFNHSLTELKHLLNVQ